MLSKAELQRMIGRGLSTRKISVEKRVSFSTVRYWLKVHRLETNPSRGIPKKLCECGCGNQVRFNTSRFFSSQCCSNFEHSGYVAKWLKGEVDGVIRRKSTRSPVTVSHHVRRWLIEIRGERCEKCGWNEVHPVTGKVPVQVHHVDGDVERTTPRNLQLLCPNCHALTDNWGGRNKGRGKRIHRICPQGVMEHARLPAEEKVLSSSLSEDTN